MAESGVKSSAKRKKIVLSIEDKLEILELLQKGTSYTIVSEKYGIGRSTVANIKKNESKLKVFKQRMTDMGVKSVDTKAMKLGTYEKLDAALYMWFRQQRERNVPVSGCTLTRPSHSMLAQVFSGDSVSDMVSRTCPFKVNKCQLTSYLPVNFNSSSFH